jgi:hypothetical protein
MFATHLRSAGVRGRLLVSLSTLLCVAMLMIPLGGGSASAAGATPTITGFAASPATLKTGSGAVRFSAKVVHATSCVLSSTSDVPGLPLTIRCGSGASKSFAQGIVLEQNTGTSPLKYTFKLKATGAGGSAVETLKVKVAVGAAQAWPTSFTGTYVGSDDSGDMPNGNFTFSGSIYPNVECDADSCSYQWTSLAGSWSASPPPCSSYTADESQGIGGSGNLELDPSESPEQLVGGFDFSVWSQVCVTVSTNFVSHITSNPTFSPGTAVSVWPSDSGGTYTFDWIYP